MIQCMKSDELGLSEVGHILLQQSKYIYREVIRMYRSIYYNYLHASEACRHTGQFIMLLLWYV